LPFRFYVNGVYNHHARAPANAAIAAFAGAQIRYEATHDHLTGLFNRPFIETRLQYLLNQKDLSTLDLSIKIGSFQSLLAIL